MNDMWTSWILLQLFSMHLITDFPNICKKWSLSYSLHYNFTITQELIHILFLHPRMQSNNNNSNHFFFKYLENQLLHIQKKSCSTSTNTFQILDSLCEYIWKYTRKNSWRKLQNPLKKKKALFKRRIHVGLFIRPKFYKRQWRRRCYRDAFYGRGRERWTRVSFCKYNRGSWIVAFGHTRTWRDNKDCSCDWRRSGTSGMGTFASRRMRTRPISENLHAFFRRWRTRGWNLPLVGNTLEQKRHNAQVRWHRARLIDQVFYAISPPSSLDTILSMRGQERHTFLYVWFVRRRAGHWSTLVERKTGIGRDIDTYETSNRVIAWSEAFLNCFLERKKK